MLLAPDLLHYISIFSLIVDNLHLFSRCCIRMTFCRPHDIRVTTTIDKSVFSDVSDRSGFSAFQIFTYTDEIQLDFLYCPITFSIFFSLTYFARQPSYIIQTIEHDLYNRTSHIGPTTSTTRMTSPLDTAFAHRLLLAHLCVQVLHKSPLPS